MKNSLIQAGLALLLTWGLAFPFPVSAADKVTFENRYVRKGMDIQVQTVCLDAKGQAVTGVVSKNGQLYYFRPDGTLQYGLGNGYYTDSEGVLQTGHQQIAGTSYWFGKDGKWLEGVQDLDGDLFLFQDGQKLKGTVTFDGHEVELDETSGHLENGVVDGTIYKNGEAAGFLPQVSYLSQRDSAWAGKDLTGYGSIASTGCVPTVAAMAVNALTGSDLTPVDTGTLLHEGGYYGVVRNNSLSRGTYSDGWGYVGSSYHLDVEPAEGCEQMASILGNGGLIAASVHGIFVNGCNHEILMTETDGSGHVYVMDPLNQSNNGWYDLSAIEKVGSTEWYNQFQGSPFVSLMPE